MQEAVASRQPGFGYMLLEWRSDLSVLQRLGLAVAVACVTGLAAQARVPLPWTPVPVTGQTLAVLLSGVLLGRWWGGIGQIMYVGLGAMGLPWFTGWSGGSGVLAGPTGGYLIGFVLAAFFVGYVTDGIVRQRRLLSLLLIMLVANFVLIHVPGLLQLRLWYRVIAGTSISMRDVLFAGTVPFIAGDIIKVIAAAGIAVALTPGRVRGS